MAASSSAFQHPRSQKMDAGALLWKGSYRITHTANQPGEQGKDCTLSPGSWCQRDPSPSCVLSFCSSALKENKKDVYCFLQHSPDWRMSSLSHRICHVYKISVSVQSRISKQCAMPRAPMRKYSGVWSLFFN